MGDSDDEASGFDGFTSNDISKKGKSDIALDLVINNDHLLMKFDLESDSDKLHIADGGDGSDSDIPLPTAAKPSGIKCQKRSSKRVRDEVTTHWSDKTWPEKPDIRFAG